MLAAPKVLTHIYVNKPTETSLNLMGSYLSEGSDVVVVTVGGSWADVQNDLSGRIKLK